MAGLLLLGCTPSVHNLAPYRDDPEAAAALEAAAVERCAELRGGPERPPADFTTDGCSASPDGGWVGCCVAHDMEYWCGGSAADRQHADRRFRDCVARDHGQALGALMYWGVRVGGTAWSPFPWRWGYGWPWSRGYEHEPASNP